MGITGLLPFLDKASEKINIQMLANKSVAIDSYCWLHKGAFAVGDKLVRGEETDVHITYCLKYVNMLLSHNIKPILVFDGRHLPAKAETEAKRRENRKNAKERAIELMRKGNHSEARNYLRRCVDVTHEMALQLIKSCRALNVDCVVAPYEADAQLAFLNKIGLADYVITEDSDLTLFGCQKILFKLDLAGYCTLVDASKLHLAMDIQNQERFTMDKFRLMCILSGCDYIDSLPGIGLAKACKFVKKTEETDIMRALDKIPAYLNMRQLTITEEYKINVLKAQATFLHMVVFDPRKRKQVRLNEIEELGTNIEYCCNAGVIIDDETALQLAVGNLNPFTMKKLDDWHPDQRERPKFPTKINKNGLRIAKHASIWHRDYRWTVSLNGAGDASNQKPVTKPAEKKPKKTLTPKRHIDAIEDSEDENLPTESQNDDLVVNQYVNGQEPLQKRFKEQYDIDDRSTDEEKDAEPQKESETTPNRNPFKKSVCKDELLSPTRISKENNSLVKTQSPVKKIDYAKLGKLSRFGRTVVPQKQNVISRFFNPTTETTVKTEKKSPKTELKSPKAGMTSPKVGMKSPKTEIKSPKANSGAQMKSPNFLDIKTESPKSELYFTKSNDSGFSPGTEDPFKKNLQNESSENSAEDELTQENQCSILNKFKCVLKEKMDGSDSEPMETNVSSQTMSDTTESEINELPIVLSDGENDFDGSQPNTDTESSKQTWLSSSQKSTNAKKSLARKATTKGKKATSSTSKKSTDKSSGIQSRLGMFGFQKKSELKH